MSTRRISLEEAKTEELLTFCVEILGLPRTGLHNAKPETLRARIAAAGYDKDYIELTEVPVETQRVNAPKAEVAASPFRNNLPANWSGKRMRVMIAEDVSGEKGGNNHVYVGVNGFPVHIPRGKPIDIPVEVHRVLMSSVELQPIKDPETMAVTGYREVPYYPVSTLGPSDSFEDDLSLG
ncbi:MAG: hypothetical protein AAF416_14365 [Pseudomonadota bacterium]